MEITARFEDGRFVPLEKVRLSNGQIVKLNLVPEIKFAWKGALRDIKSGSVELQHKISDMW